MLISIFILLLISVVAIALIVSSGTESALAGNYRSSTSVYYDALGGIEEARGRLAGKGPSAFRTTDPAFLPPPGTALLMGKTYYLVNPVQGEDITPWDLSSTYPDRQFFAEFGVSPTSPSPTALSIWNKAALNPGNYPGPLYKWVRINAVSEQSLNVDADADGRADSTTPLYYTGAGFSNNPSAGAQVIELTAYAILPNGSQKILQYVVAPASLNLVFPAALTLDGYSDSYAGPNHNYFQIMGNNATGNSACGSMPYPVPAVVVPDSSDVTNVISGIPTSPTDERPNYTGSGSAPNIISQVPLAPNLQTVQSLNQLAQTIIQNADAVIAGPATQSNFPSAMSSTNPLTIAIQGDVTLSGSFTGYGLLLVTGSLSYDPDIEWNGIVLVIGQGIVTSFNGGSNGLFSGAMLIAKTRNPDGTPLTGPNPGPATFNDAGTTGGVGRGIFYNCSWVQAAMPSLTYKVLSFHEITQ